MSIANLSYRRTTGVIRLEQIMKLTAEGVERAAWGAARILKHKTNADILRAKSGRKYRVPNASFMVPMAASRRYRSHTASSPGETHANMTGQLRRSLGFKVRLHEFEFGYFNAPKYAGAIEFGRKDKTIASRPSLRNNIKRSTADIKTSLEREIKRNLADKIMRKTKGL